MCHLKILIIWLDKRPPSVENVCFGGRKGKRSWKGKQWRLLGWSVRVFDSYLCLEWMDAERFC